MIILAILIIVFLVAILVPSRGGRRSARDAARLGLAVAMVFSGVSHFVALESFLPLLPPFVPYPTAVILVTGVVEVLLGVGLVIPRRWRREVALALVIYLVAVFPANVYAAVAGVETTSLGGLDNWARLPFQAIYIAWVFWAVPDTIGPLRSAVHRLRGHRVTERSRDLRG